MKDKNSIAKATDVLPLPLVDTEVFKYGEKVNEQRHTKTNPEDISYRKGKKGKEYKYIKKEVGWNWLDIHYPVNSFELDTSSVRELAGFFYVKGILKVYVTELSIFRVVEAWGCDEIEFKQETKEPVILMYLKNAETDAFKRCLVKLGAFNDVYSEIETDSRIIPDEDLEWYVNTILPVVMKGVKSAKGFFTQVRMFSNGSLSKEQLYEHYFGG